MPPDPLDAALLKLADHSEQITALTGQLAALTDLIAQLTPDGTDSGRYQPGPAPPWWKLAAADRAEPLARLQVVSALAVFSAIRVAVGLPCWEAVPSHVVPRQAAARRR
jgi:hypothetical protein